jgi:NAD-dependent deacetylase
MTDVAMAFEAADVILILGTNIYSEKIEFQVSPDSEKLKILFTSDEFVNNRQVDFVIRDEISAFLPLVIE